MKNHIEELVGYGVLIERGDGTKTLALAGTPGRFIAYKRPQAVQFKKELKQHLQKQKIRVVKMHVSWKVIS